MQREEIVAVGELAGDAVTGLSAHIRDLHGGVAERVWRSVGPMAAPVRSAHDGIASAVYTAIEKSLRPLVRTGAKAASVARRPDAPSIHASPRARVVLGLLNGAFGDRLDDRANALALPMTLRAGGRDVHIDRAALAHAYPHTTPRLAVFVHGLCQTDEAWLLGARRRQSYGERLRAELGYTPLYVRYNSGRHISYNGRALGGLLDAVVREWPVEVEEIALIGHSMGALVSRSACHYHAASDFAAKVRHIIALGSPHRGTPLEFAACMTSAAFSRLPETRSLSGAINARSAGIKDLGRGYLVEEDWRDHDPQAFLTRTGQEVPFLRTANHYFVSGSVSRDPNAPLGRMLGDMLVPRASAWAHGGRGEKLHFPVENYAHIGAVNHIELLNHPAVYEQIRRWLTGRPALPAPAPRLPPGESRAA